MYKITNFLTDSVLKLSQIEEIESKKNMKVQFPINRLLYAYLVYKTHH